MIYVTGDIHGSIDIRKLLENNVTNQITEKDYVIICGDFGLVWNYKRQTRQEKKWLDWLNSQRWTTLFADGNHECFPRLYSYPVKDWMGGKVHEIRPKVLHLMRGEIFEIEGNSIFVMGGAASHDRGPAKGDTDAVIGKGWWPEEIPSEEEKRNGLENLARYNNEVDYVITHCLPTFYQDYIKKGEFPPDAASEYLQYLTTFIKYKHWYSGHYHCNIDLSENVTVVFSRIIPIGTKIRDCEMIMGIPKFRRNETVLVDMGDEKRLGIVLNVEPWGPFMKHDEPYYEIHFYGDEIEKHGTKVRESQIVEKSLIS